MKKVFLGFLSIISFLVFFSSIVLSENNNTIVNLNDYTDIQVVVDPINYISENEVKLSAKIKYNSDIDETDLSAFLSDLYNNNDSEIFFEYKKKTETDWQKILIEKPTYDEINSFITDGDYSFLEFTKTVTNLEQNEEYDFRFGLLYSNQTITIEGVYLEAVEESDVNIIIKEITFNPKETESYQIGEGFGLKVNVEGETEGIEENTMIPFIVKAYDDQGVFVDSCYEQNIVDDDGDIEWSCYINDIQKPGEYTFKTTVDFGNKFDKTDIKKEKTIKVATNNSNKKSDEDEIKSFIDCQNAGYLVFSADPRKCIANGKLYQEDDNKFEGVKCSASQILTQNMKIGDRNGKYSTYQKGTITEVKILQKHLNRLGYGAGVVDGIIGPITERAIKKIQKFLGVVPDGIVGPITIKAINYSCQDDGTEENKNNKTDINKINFTQLNILIKQMQEAKDEESKNIAIALIAQEIIKANN